MKKIIGTAISSLLFVACAKPQSQTASGVDSVSPDKVTAPKIARCSAVSTIETTQIRETLIVEVAGDVVSGTYHFATGDRNSLTDTGFQHLLGKISKNDATSADKVVLSLKNGSLTTYFDEDFAPRKELNSVSYNLKEKSVSFSVETDARLTTVGNCQFE